jgi:hypothetical protein
LIGSKEVTGGAAHDHWPIGVNGQTVYIVIASGSSLVLPIAKESPAENAMGQEPQEPQLHGRPLMKQMGSSGIKRMALSIGI